MFLLRWLLDGHCGYWQTMQTKKEHKWWALQGFVFKTFSVTAIHECDMSCEREITCQSYNYVIGEKSCELNNRTKEARPENFLRDPSRFYHKRLVDRGM